MIQSRDMLWSSGGLLIGLGFGSLFLVVSIQPEISTNSKFTTDTATLRLDEQSADPVGWPALFGTPLPPAVDQLEIQPTETAAEYTLKGLVSAGPRGWAILSGADGDILVNQSSRLPGDGVVVAINADGVEIEQNGRRLTVEFSAEDIPAGENVVELAEARFAGSKTLSLRELQKTDLRRTLALAGGIQSINQGGGALAQQVIWVRKGMLYDQIGLQPGDLVFSINGIPAGDTEAIMAAIPELSSERRFELVVEREGARMNLEVVVDEDV